VNGGNGEFFTQYQDSAQIKPLDYMFRQMKKHGVRPIASLSQDVVILGFSSFLFLSPLKKSGDAFPGRACQNSF
jgi:hypothetical protein